MFSHGLIVTILEVFLLLAGRGLTLNEQKENLSASKHNVISDFGLAFPQRDLDFTIELEFKGQLCEASIAHDYRMR